MKTSEKKIINAQANFDRFVKKHSRKKHLN